MFFVLVLVCTLALCLLFRKVIYKYAWIFYTLAIIISLMFALTSYVNFPFWLQQALFQIVQKGTLATALFMIVMYIGAFKDIAFVQRWLVPIRANLSILACLLILGHAARYFIAYVARLFTLPATTMVGIFVAFVCAILLVILGVTSLQAVKRRMHASTWTKLQKWAYLFYALVYVHLLFMLLPSALEAGSAGITAVVSLIIYTVLFGAYLVLRIVRRKSLRLSNKKEEES